jgi:hypothetical protein
MAPARGVYITGHLYKLAALKVLYGSGYTILDQVDVAGDSKGKPNLQK